MKSILAAIVTCLILFGVSAGTTKFFYQPTADEDAVGETRDGAPSISTAAASQQSADHRPTAVPVAFRPDQAVSVEAVLQMSDSIKKMEQQLIDREQRVRKEELRVKLLFDDLATEQDELRAFSEGIDAKVDLLNQLTGTLKTTLDSLDARKAELTTLAKETGSDDESKQTELDNKVNDVKSWFANLEATQAADYLKEFANNGKLEFAATLLQKMPDRQKSKILGAMSDPILVDQLIDALAIRPKK
ncbi:MAG: hypothetical protein HKN47_29725 [Pirellulaceae bacterium]|nr:hypothetical protein [Pirellulaceae bacterium]